MEQHEPRRGTLTPEQEQRILDYAGQGFSGRRIAEQPDIVVSQQTVNRYLREHRQERSETSRAIVREHLSATLPTDLERLDQLSARLEVLRQEAENMGLAGFNMEMNVIDRQVKTIGLKLKYSGAGEDDSAQRLLDALMGDD